MIARDPNERPSAEECLNDVWLQNAVLSRQVAVQIDTHMRQHNAPVPNRPEPPNPNRQTRMSPDGIEKVEHNNWNEDNPAVRRLNNVLHEK